MQFIAGGIEQNINVIVVVLLAPPAPRSLSVVFYEAFQVILKYNCCELLTTQFYETRSRKVSSGSFSYQILNVVVIFE
jgi:hypothetical protein